MKKERIIICFLFIFFLICHIFFPSSFMFIYLFTCLFSLLFTVFISNIYYPISLTRFFNKPRQRIISILFFTIKSILPCVICVTLEECLRYPMSLSFKKQTCIICRCSNPVVMHIHFFRNRANNWNKLFSKCHTTPNVTVFDKIF